MNVTTNTVFHHRRKYNLFTVCQIALTVLMISPPPSHALDINKDNNTSTLVTRYTELAGRGDAKSAYWLSHHFKSIKNSEAARNWLIQAAKLGDQGAIVEIGYDSPYTAKTTFTCGSLTATIQTNCSEIDKTDALPVCQQQKISLHTRKKSHSYTFINQQKMSRYALARTISCFKSKNSTFIAIESSNLGSGLTCLDCERTDLFDNNTKYLGSVGKLSDLIIIDDVKKSNIKPSPPRSSSLQNPLSETDINTFPTIK